jgi:hypothetical protein
MDVIEELAERLKNIPGARYEVEGDSITVLPTSPDGFTVSAVKNGDGYTVFFNGWHEDFESAEETVTVFGLGLSDECRLREYRRGSFVYRWTVEFLEDGQWEEQSTTGLLLFPFWRRPQMRYLQNGLLPPK